MFGIGTVANLAQVSVRTLRYYDELGLLRPWWVDPDTGYRWYSAEQILRLHRIVALRDLGVKLGDIAVLLEEDLSADELRGILLLRRAEAHDRMTAEADRLARVEGRLHQLEEHTMTPYDVVIKAVDPMWVIATSAEVAGFDGIGPAHAQHWPQLHAALDELGIDFAAPSIAAEHGTGPIRITFALPVPDDTHYEAADIATRQLPGLERAATTVVRGDPTRFAEGFAALQTWATNTGEVEAGALREVYLDCDGPRDSWVTELQLALRDP